METKLYTLEEVANNNGKNGNRVWIIIKHNVYDVTDYLDEHPGGGELITEWAGKECTRAFDDAGHSSEAKSKLKQYKIGEISKGDKVSKKQNPSTEASAKENRRSFCSYVTCGICG